MADVQEAGAAARVRPVTQSKPAHPGAPPAAEPAPEKRDVLEIYKKLPFERRTFGSPEERARAQLKQLALRLEHDVSQLDEAIARRQAERGWASKVYDPALSDLRKARAELVRARDDARSGLSALSGSYSMLKHAPGHIGGMIWNPPDLARAEERVNTMLGRLARAEHHLARAAEQLQPPGGMPIYKCPGRDGRHFPPADSVRDLVSRVAGDLRYAQAQAESAREDIWDAQDGANRLPPWEPRPVPRPPILIDPPFYYDKLPAKDGTALAAAKQAGAKAGGQ